MYSHQFCQLVAGVCHKQLAGVSGPLLAAVVPGHSEKLAAAAGDGESVGIGAVDL